MHLSPASALTWTFQNSGVGSALNSVYFLDASTGFAVGNSGVFLKTSDGGVTWTNLSPTGNNLDDVEFVPGTAVGAAVGANGTVVLSTDGGSNFTLPTSGTSNTLFGISLADNSTFYAAGTLATVVKSTDSGTSWSSGDPTSFLSANGFGTLNSMFFVQPSTGWVVDAAGKIARTDNGGQDWTNLSMATVTAVLKDVFFVSPSTGWIVGNSGTLMKTVDAGSSWTQQISTTANLNSIFFVSSGTGYAVGDAGVIFRSTDSGNSWTSESSTMATTNLNKVFFISQGQGYAVGTSGTILLRSTATLGSVSLPDVPNGSLKAVDNLFDPTQGQTMSIQFSLKQAGKATLRIYTMQGRLVRTLLQDDPRAADTTYTVPWDGRNDAGEIVASGIYLAHIDGPGYFASRKIAVVE